MASENEIISAHEARGRYFNAAGVRSFALDQGSGETVLCLHGVPASSFLYRKVVAELAGRGMRGVAIDFPGLGLADRPEDFDYSWTGLGRFAAAAVDALGLKRFHLVVHDIGGPVGFELAGHHPDRILSLTILNTLIEAHEFHRPWVMHPFSIPIVGEIYLALISRPIFRVLMRLQGVHSMATVTAAELDAWVGLLKRGDGGRALLKIMRGFELTKTKTDLYLKAVQNVTYPLQILWGQFDPALKWKTRGQRIKEITGVDDILLLPGKHFLQEDNAAAIAEQIVRLAKTAA